jgi:selenocysteine lyase/cysteine desulfurase
MEVARFREQIPACQGMVYMNAGASGPSPVSVVDAIKERLDYEMGQGPTSPDVSQSRMEIRTEAREAVAELLNAAPEEICLTKNTTEGLNIVLNGLPWRHGDELITFSLEHSSVLVPSYFQQRRHGVVVKVLPLAANEQREVIQSKIGAALSQHTQIILKMNMED